MVSGMIAMGNTSQRTKAGSFPECSGHVPPGTRIHLNELRADTLVNEIANELGALEPLAPETLFCWTNPALPDELLSPESGMEIKQLQRSCHKQKLIELPVACMPTFYC